MKVAHLILAHANPEQLHRLVQRLTHPCTDIYIHLDGKCNMAQFAEVAALPQVFFIQDRVKVYWGSYSMVKATVNSFLEIKSSKIVYSHVNLISGQDYPLKSADEFCRFLADNTGKSFINALDINREWPDGQARINSYFLGDFHFPGRYKLQALINKFVKKRKFPEGLKPYGLSQWCTLTPAAIDYVLNYLKNNKKAIKFFRTTYAPDEYVFQTILYNNFAFKDHLVNDNLRYIDIPKGQARPVVFTIADYEMLKRSGAYFTRKTDPASSASLMDKLDEELMQPHTN